ncbi:hypothetical protein F8C76_16740 [Flagellimonas olearia]|uniref:Uncharacterized protein n=1 Tax=Flagellimonas olearia TaxID=552546 RepID=A0A6I1DWD2_9FLAO|nr:hypothetical protein F8C76_16740 [Allomuricauda olearia]
MAIDLTPYVNNDTNELQDLSLTGNNLSLSDDPTATPIDLGAYLDNTDAQDLSLTGNILALTGDPTPVAIDLTPYINNDTNELQDLSLTGNNLSLSDDPTATPIDLGVYLDNTDAQDLSLTGNILALTGDPTPVAIDLTPYVNNDTNELQDLSLSAGNILTLSTPATPANQADLSILNETVSAGTGITVTPTPASQDFEVAVTNPVIAMGRVSGGALGSNFGVSNFADNTNGDYDITLSTTPTDFVVQLSTNSAAGPRTIQVTAQGANTFSIQIYDASGTPIDSDWSFTVISF